MRQSYLQKTDNQPYNMACVGLLLRNVAAILLETSQTSSNLLLIAYYIQY